MFLAQALSSDGSCQHIVNQVALKRALGGCATMRYGYGRLLSGALTPARADDR